MTYIPHAKVFTSLVIISRNQTEYCPNKRLDSPPTDYCSFNFRKRLDNTSLLIREIVILP